MVRLILNLYKCFGRRASERAPRLIGPLPRGGEYKPGPRKCCLSAGGSRGLAPRRRIFQINTGNFSLEVQVEGRPGWLLACHERWNLSLGTLICRQLGYLQLARHKGVNLTDVKVNDTQEFVQIVPNQKSSIEDVWQEQLCFRANCGSEVLRYRRPQVSSWLVFAGIIAHMSVPQQARAVVEKIIHHPRYDDRSHNYDIALMKLRAPLNFSGEREIHREQRFAGVSRHCACQCLRMSGVPAQSTGG
ncbi:transmembrane protease serine 5-like [Mauremys mutica]|uniref:transmembrane protease serine 5-like n=1 Tax=Mauremys mutica TaxID=74926 RepID=UPI001D16EAF5|nr:transmembrane protease serine 5-like [Mauremys mutica]